MIQYIYSKEIGPNNEKYYQIYGSSTSIEVESIIKYCDLVGVDFLTIFNITWSNDTQLVKSSFLKYGAWYLCVERSIIKDMKRLGLLEIEYKYKKKDR